MSRAKSTPSAASLAARGHAAVWRADLVRMMALLPEAQVARAAPQLGFTAPKELRSPAPKAVPPIVESPVEPQAPVELAALQTPFFRLEKMTFAEESGTSDTPLASSGLEAADLHSPDHNMLFTPQPEPLAPWSRLWPALRAALQGSAPTRNPDVQKLLHKWSRGEVVHQIPKVTRRVWAERVSIWVDRSPRITPFRVDQDDVYRRLLRCCGRAGVQVRVLHAGHQHAALTRRGDFLAGFRPDPEQPVLVLGDLAAYASVQEQQAWLRTGQRLLRANVRIAALMPVPRTAWPRKLTQTWSAISWERGRRATIAQGGQKDRRHWQSQADRLLRLASPAAFVHLGLLRALRRLLPASETDATTEVEVFRHSDVRAADSMGLVLHAEAAMRHRQQFVEHESVELKAQVSHTMAHWHENVPRELLHIETLTWMGLEKEASPPGNLEEALAFAQRLTTSLQPGMEKVAAVSATIRRCAQAMLGSLPDSAYKALPQLQPMWAAAYDGIAGVRVPQDLDPSRLYPPKPSATPRWWSIRQVGKMLVFALSEGSAWPSADTSSGSPIAWLYCAGPNLFAQWSREKAERQLVLKEGLTIPLQAYQSLTLRSDRSSITIASWSKEPWAVAAGRDRYGLWADADVKGVSLRFRWIPPGRFLMGSPKQEAGRDNDEGPQHEVTWTAGRWLADVPCTQALWQAVQGENPSHFVSPERPVEQVSWEDCQDFLRKLNTLIPGLAARLPSEAEWEHACRAGTQTATWLGDLEILGANNAPLLDDIAWYGGNSSERFELENGDESSDWLNKQYPGSRSGTHPVRQKDENPFGLFDMLGNVLEWCMDGADDYKGEPLLNPDAQLVGYSRVLRGGAWSYLARYVRAAHRVVYDPGNRIFLVGFRVARGPGASLPPEAVARNATPPRSGDRAIPAPKKKK